MKKILYLLIIFLLACSPAYAFEDTVENYPSNTISDYWSCLQINGVSPAVYEYPTLSGYHTIKFQTSKTTGTSNSHVKSVQLLNSNYTSFTIKSLTATSTNSTNAPVAGGTVRINLEWYRESHYDLEPTIYTESIGASGINLSNITYEIIRTQGRFLLYKNGVYISDLGAAPSDTYADTNFYIKLITTGGSNIYTTATMYIDDISNEGSTIGIKQTYTEASSNFLYTHRIQSYANFPTSVYSVTLYSLSNTNNAGVVASQTLTTQSGNNLFPRSLVNENTGLYLLELTRDNTILRDEYFIYYLSTDPQSYPEILFLGESDVLTDIRDEDNNGGETSSSVYLYPDIQADGTYNFTYDILETPYSIKTELTTVYNNTAIHSATINYSGLSNQNYNISVDGAEVGSTNGADTYSYTFTDWSTETNHIISFAPDYTLAGVWGEVKNSETQEGIKSATVSVSGDNFSKTLYTDDNGLFYLTKGLEAGKTYTISVSKTGYSTPPSQTAITVEGSTTRQDFYMDKLSTTGSGLYYAPHDVGFTVLEYWYSGAGLTGVNYAIYNGTESIKTGTTDSKGMFAGSDMTGGTNYTITLTHNGTTYTEYVEPSLTEYTFVLNKEGILHQYVNSWLTLSYTENSQNVTIAYNSNKTITGASLTAIAGNGTTVYSQTLNTTTGTFTFETGGEGDYILNFHIQATDGSTASQSWGLSYPDKIPLFPDSYPAWLKNVLFSGIVMVFLLAFGKSKNDIACGAVAILTSMGYLFEWFTGSFYFVVLVWIIALGAVFLHYKRTGGIG